MKKILENIKGNPKIEKAIDKADNEQQLAKFAQSSNTSGTLNYYGKINTKHTRKAPHIRDAPKLPPNVDINNKRRNPKA